MKKLTLFIIAAAFSWSAANAQSSDKNFHFGLNFTPGYYWLSASSPNAKGSGSLGYGFGVNLEFYFTQNYGFCTGLELTSFKANYTNTTSWTAKNLSTADSITAHALKVQYLEIPLLLKLKTLPIGLMKYFGIVGLNPGIRVKATDSYTVTGLAINPAGNSYTANYNVSNVSASSKTSVLRLAYLIGAGVEYNIAGSTSLQGAISFDSDFLNMLSGSNSVTNKTIKLTIGVLF